MTSPPVEYAVKRRDRLDALIALDLQDKATRRDMLEIHVLLGGGLVSKPVAARPAHDDSRGSLAMPMVRL